MLFLLSPDTGGSEFMPQELGLFWQFLVYILPIKTAHHGAGPWNIHFTRYPGDFYIHYILRITVFNIHLLFLSTIVSQETSKPTFLQRRDFSLKYHSALLNDKGDPNYQGLHESPIQHLFAKSCNGLKIHSIKLFISSTRTEV